MSAVHIVEVRAAGVAVNRLLETLFVAVAGSVVRGAQFSIPRRVHGQLYYPAGSTPFSSFPASAVADNLPLRFHPVVHVLLLVVVVPAFVPV